MVAVTRTAGGYGVGDGPTGRVTNAGGTFYMAYSFDPTSASQVLLGYLPSGAIVVDVLGKGGATGGTDPTVDIGTAADDDGFANELDCDAGTSSALVAGTTGALHGTAVSGVTAVYAKVGASAATGGTHTGFIVYTVS